MDALVINRQTWVPIKDGDPAAWAVFQRHYSRRIGNRRGLWVGPGNRMVLALNDYSAIWVWRRFLERGQSHPRGVLCAVFRREEQCTALASDLIESAMSLAWERWPGERLYTYVNPRAIQSTNPGYCFQVAGWRKCRQTSKGLIELEIYPTWSESLETIGKAR